MNSKTRISTPLLFIATAFILAPLGVQAQGTPIGGPIYYLGGSVGIGTDNPANVLELKSTTVNAGMRADGASTGAAYFYNSQSGAGQDRATMSVNAFYNGSAWSYVNTALPSWAVQVRTNEDDFVVGRGNPGSPPANTFLRISNTGFVTVNGNVNVTGTLTAGTLYANYQDVAEWVPAAESMPSGTVVVLSDEVSNTVTPSSHAYDTGVAGVVSPSPGLLLGTEGPAKAKIATTGRVRVRVDANKAPIRMGDLLVTSDRPGMAMKSEPLDLGGVKIHRPGTLIGKALEPLGSGEGEILVLLSLQ